jgi:hypothetical protein
MVVGEDALSRTIAEIRRVARTTAAGFAVETIPRIGYRLVVSSVAAEPAPAQAADPAVPATPASEETRADAHPILQSGSRRRWMLAAGAATVAVAWAVWRGRAPQAPARYTQLLDQGKQAMRINLPADRLRTIELMEEATGVFPDGAEAWGLLALARFHVADASPGLLDTQLTQACEAAVSRALALDAHEQNALAARILLGRKLDDWYVTEARLRGLLAQAPRNAAALDHLTAQLQAAGYMAESHVINERALSFDRLRPMPLARKVLKLWIMGDASEADRVAAAALELYPAHPLVVNSRLLAFAFTDRWQAARLFIEAQPPDSGLLSPTLRAAWRVWIDALETRSATDVARAREAALSAAPTSPVAAVHAIMVASALGQVDAAYRIIDGLLLRRGDVVANPGASPPVNVAHDSTWRGTQWLFTPATRALREDPRFGPLCEMIGLSKYWQRRGVVPDERRGTDSGST